MVELAANLPVVPRLFGEMSVEHLRELQRFAEVGRVSASLIHDISSPLTAAILHLEQEEQRGIASIKHARRSIRVLERYIEAARQQLRQENRVTSFYVKSEVDQLKRIMRPLAQRQNIRLRFNLQANHKLMGDPVKFQQIMSNLITNAMEAYIDFSNPLAIEPLVQVTIKSKQQQLIIRIRDWGEGITKEQLPFIFEPFYTTKQSSVASGTGIGLSTVRRYVEDDFGGRITVTSSPPNGTEFCVKLKLSEFGSQKN